MGRRPPEGSRTSRDLQVRRRLPSVLSAGPALPADRWGRRHRHVRLLLWAHAAGLTVFALVRGVTVGHALLAGAVLAAFALAAGRRRWSTPIQAGTATLGLLVSSALLTYLSGGMVEAHVHFFVMIVVVSLYQSWSPFLVALGFVVVHHGLVGTISPATVYNHPGAQPWLWALVHGGFVVAQAAACLAGWRVNEHALERERRARSRLEAAHRDLVEAQAISKVGSWEWDLTNDSVWWSPQMRAIAGVAEEALVYDVFLQLVHPGDRARVAAAVQHTIHGDGQLDEEYRIVRPDGQTRILHARGRVRADSATRHLVGTCQDITERKELEAAVRHQSLHDPLTGLGNRTLFLERADEALAVRQRCGLPVALLYLDLDDFKTVNDSLGHAHGDRLLIEVAGRLRATTRDCDTVARFGGDEFAVLLADVDAAGAAEAAAHIAAVLREPITVDGRTCTVAASVGVAIAEAGINTADLLRNADLAMYAAKRGEHAPYAVFTDDMLSTVMTRMDLKAELAGALTAGQFLLHYQPVGDLRTGQLWGVEALVRWLHPTRGMVPPGAFIPLAEETGMIIPLGAWVTNEACRQAVALHQLHGEQFAVTVNLSAVQLLGDIVTTVAEALDDSGLPARCLVLEITETAVMRQDAGALAKLAALRARGVRIAIDDFGTGYSSLGYLRDLPVDILKIDRSFVHGLTSDAESPTLVRSMVQMSQAFGLQTVAEGIETAEEAALAREFGCDLGQGFHLCPPQPPAQLLTRLLDWPLPPPAVEPPGAAPQQGQIAARRA